jgi:hypothetical protein
LAACVVATPAHGDLFEKVEGVVDGVIELSGRPAADALITACVEGYLTSDSRCSKVISVRTDSAGRFSFRQFTGRRLGNAEREEQRRFVRTYGGVLENPFIAFGFRIDYEGMAGQFLYLGKGPGPTSVDVKCDLSDLLKHAKLSGVRPVAVPGNVLEIWCPFESRSEDVAE